MRSASCEPSLDLCCGASGSAAQMWQARSHSCREGKDARVHDLVEANAIVQHLRDTADLGIHFRPIPIERVRICVFADASLNTVSGCKSQGATMLCLVDQDLLEGKEGIANLVLWRSGTIDRVCAGSLAAEANAMAAACHQAEWTQQAFCEMTNASFDDYNKKTVLRDWESSSEGRPVRTVVRGALIIKEGTDEKLRHNIGHGCQGLARRLGTTMPEGKGKTSCTCDGRDPISHGRGGTDAPLDSTQRDGCGRPDKGVEEKQLETVAPTHENRENQAYGRRRRG